MSQEATICYDKICAKVVIADQVISGGGSTPAGGFGHYVNTFTGGVGLYTSPLFPLPSRYKITINLYGINSTDNTQIASSNLIAVVNPAFPSGYRRITQDVTDSDGDPNVVDLTLDPVTKTIIVGGLPGVANFNFIAEIQVLYF